MLRARHAVYMNNFLLMNEPSGVLVAVLQRAEARYDTCGLYKMGCYCGL